MTREYASEDSYAVESQALIDESSKESIYTRSASQEARSYLRSLAPKLLIFISTVLIIITLAVPSSIIVSQHRHARLSYNHVAELSAYMHDHPERDGWGRAFAQMGLRARLYAQILQQHDEEKSALPTPIAAEDIWSFVPGIARIQETIRASASSTNRRGIVIPVSKRFFGFACHFLTTLRQVHKSSMPVEIMYYGEADLSKDMRDELMWKYDVRTVNMEELGLFDEGFAEIRRGGWAIKPFAMLASSFAEVILVDADTILLTAPENFFQQEGYLDTGTMFFQDRLTTERSEKAHEFILQQLGGREPSVALQHTPFWKRHLWHYQESGVVVMDRSRPSVLAGLLFTAWQNTGVIRNTISYKLFLGDKETYWLAFELAGLPYYMVDSPAGTIGALHSAHMDGYCSDHILHLFDPEHHKGEISNALGLPAWLQGSLLNNKFHGADALLNVSDSIWAMDGDWTWHRDKWTWCLHNYTAHSIREHGLDVLLTKMVEATQENINDSKGTH